MGSVGGWWERRGGKDWKELRAEAMALLQREAELEEIVKLIGADALPEPERAVLEAARMVRENFLQQFAFDEVDTYCPPEKQAGMLRLLLKFYRKAVEAAREGTSVTEIRKLPVREELARMKKLPPEEFGKGAKELEKKIEEQFGGLGRAKG